MAGTLYLVGTPIGNLGDISPRALETLEAVDFIAAEDTRVTLKLLNHFGLKKPLVSYYEHNRMESGEKILRRLLEGETCALVTDGRFSGVSRGASIGHISPEAAAGGLLAYVQDGDTISIDIPGHKLELLVPEAEIEKRRAAIVPNPPKQVKGYLKRYRAMVTSANRGAILDEENL